MKNLVLIPTLLLSVTSCTLRPAFYTSTYDYDYNTRPIVVVPQPAVVNPYTYRPNVYWWNTWYNPYRSTYYSTPRTYSNPRPRTNVVINNYNPPPRTSGPRGGRRR